MRKIDPQSKKLLRRRIKLCAFCWEKPGYTIDFNRPTLPPDGIRYVWVGGVPALAEGKLTHALNGSVLTHG